MHKIVKIIINDDGDKVKNPKWCLSYYSDATERTYCSGECYGFGEGQAVFKTKKVKNGGITCDRCISKINEIKSIKL